MFLLVGAIVLGIARRTFENFRNGADGLHMRLHLPGVGVQLGLQARICVANDGGTSSGFVSRNSMVNS